MTVDRPFAIAAGVALAGSMLAFGAAWFAERPLKPPHVTDADVQAYLHARDMSDKVRDFHNWIDHHPDVPRTLEFPEIKSDPVLWDFTEHAVLRGVKRSWTWSDVAYAVSATIFSGTSATMIEIPAHSTATCSIPPAPAQSGGHP